MFGPVEMKRDADGHREWKYPVLSGEIDIPLGAACPNDCYAYFIGYQTKDDVKYAVYSTRLDLVLAAGVKLQPRS